MQETLMTKRSKILYQQSSIHHLLSVIPWMTISCKNLYNKN